MERSGLLATVLALHLLPAHAGNGFLILSAPRNSRISWIQLPEDGDFGEAKPKTLVDTGMRHPQGIAVDQKRKRLYVADPDVHKIYSYQLSVNGDQLVADSKQTVVAQNAESRWVAVDGLGNVFFSDEPRNLILKVPAANALRSSATPPEEVYSGASLAQVNEPGGVAVDNFHVYWTNKHFGTQVGSVVKASETPASGVDTTQLVSVLAKNTVKSYGVCLALSNVYYTDSEKFLYGVKKSGGPMAQVSSQMQHPRGCVWDGDGTVYVADRGANAVFSFAGNMHSISEAKLNKAFNYEDAFGLAVLATSGAARPLAWALLPGGLAMMLTALLMD